MNTPFPTLEIVDLDSPFFFGVARKMTPEERKDALAHGVTDDRPMSVLGITDGLAAVDGKELAELFVAAPAMLKWHQEIAALAEGFDDEGATGPRPPLTWETVARMALDYSRWAIKESGVNAWAVTPGEKGNANE